MEGFAVAGAETAAQARTVLAHSKPDLVLMDIQLPDADGLEFTRELKADPATADIPVIALTAHAMPRHERAARAAGCVGFISKPWTPEALSHDVRAILALGGEPPMTAAHRPPQDFEVSAADLDERLALLQGISIFFTLPDRDVRRLAHKLHKHSVPKGTEVVRQGAVADAMYVVAQGRCEVRASWQPRHSVTVALLAPGDFFGISAMKEGAVQPASVTALEDSELLELLTTDIDTVLTPGSRARVELEKLVEQRQVTIDEVVGRANAMASGREGHVIAVYSVKGGAGKTTIAVNLAADLGRRHRGECILIDLGLPYNHAALTANLVPTSSLALVERAADDELEE